MMDLLAFIYDQIQAVHPRVFLNKVPQDNPDIDTSYPYVVFHTPSVGEVEVREDTVLEVDIWTNNGDIVELETITDNIDKKLNRLSNLDANFQCKIYRDNPYKLSLTDEDPIIDRRRLRYNIKLYRR